ncbi:3-phosphoserine/phosphohydroxythreonine transaminase [Adhaeretor mobilis]|uniref:Phosphoserine aminotransferase n=1 Tax=Adhaeretor mobilis TaxID=1930276 RepID=A0A517MZA3_9BACT|nr:3-phosphoserine/phosphohydroxythreonine transaminase [Adhaeretor mobilis]QDT00213.1 Phosphoserine aminotransferase [Adhaeretor mobilis]
MSERVYNFSAGPAVMPITVLEKIQEHMLCLPGVGASIMEISHRSEAFKEILASAQSNLRSLLAIPDDYEVLFIQGGSRLQFSMIPMNLLSPEQPSADYLITGAWGKHSLNEANKHGDMKTVWSGQDTNFDRLPSSGDSGGKWRPTPNAAYLHYTSNETIQGVQFKDVPDTGDTPLVCDMSSDFLHRPVDVSKYGLIYACAQKNAGPAGVTVVIVRKDLIADVSEDLPGYLRYQNHAAADSMMNTPPTFGIYVLKLITDWLQEDIGGLAKMHELNGAQAKLLYDVLDANSEFYEGHAQPECRSLMNVTFRLPSKELTQKFLAEAASKELKSLAGHRSVGGIRASIYNAMPTSGVECLRDFMEDFCKQNS